MFLIGFPLLIIPFALYNMFAFIFGVTDWTAPLMSVHIISGGEWKIASGDVLIAFAVLVLFVEILKSTRIGARSIIDHMLSMLVFLGMLVEFLLVERAATSTFFLLTLISFVDVLGGFTITIRTAQRDIGLEGAEKIISS
ncbi:MAG: hypothetical protein WD073_04190 [Xanthobacteraceae bacterium]